MIHKGHSLEICIRSSNKDISTICKELKISRSYLYYKFKATSIKDDFLIQVGQIIDYDFKFLIPDIDSILEQKSISGFDELIQNIKIKNNSYKQYLERYNELLIILLKTLTEEESDKVKDKIIHYIYNQERILKYDK